MRIFMVTPVVPAEQATGSTAALLYSQVMCLRNRHAIHVLTVAGPDPLDFRAVETLAAQGISVHAVRRMDPQGLARWRRRLRFAQLWLVRGWPFRTAWFWEDTFQSCLDEVVGAHVPDLILVEDNAMGVYSYPPAIPTVFTEHEVRRPRPVRWSRLPASDLPHHVLREWDWQHWARYQPDVWRRFRHIQVFTPRDAKAMTVIAPDLVDRVAVNPFGVCVSPTPPTISGEEPESLVFVANFTHYPNVDAALWLAGEIMPQLRRLRPSVRLALVGSAPPPAVRVLACDDIAVTGWVPEIEPYLRQASVVLAPVRTGGGMRAKVVQAMALGKPVVTTSRGVEGMASGDERLPVMVADNALAFAEATEALLASPTARQDLGARAHQYAARHLGVDGYLRRLDERLGSLLPEALVS